MKFFAAVESVSATDSIPPSYLFIFKAGCFLFPAYLGFVDWAGGGRHAQVHIISNDINAGRHSLQNHRGEARRITPT